MGPAGRSAPRYSVGMRTRASPSRRRLALLVALALVGGAAWWLRGEDGRDGPGPESLPEGEKAAVGVPSLEGRRARLEPRVGNSQATSTSLLQPPAGSERAPTGSAPDDAIAPGVAALLHVTLILPASWTTRAGDVYALPAGRPGTQEGDHPRKSVPPGAGEVVLPLPRAGRWDEGYSVPGLGSVLVTDVVAEGTTEVRIDASAAAPIRFRLPRSGALPEGGRIHVSNPSGLYFPGRGQDIVLNTVLVIQPGAVLETPALAPRQVCSLLVSTPERTPGGLPGLEWALSKGTASAGDEVDLLVRPLGLVRNRLRVSGPLPEAWTKAWSVDLWFAIGAQAVGESEPSHVASTYVRKDGTLRDPLLLLPLASGSYVLSVATPRGWMPSRAPPRTVEVAAGRTTEFEWTLEPDPEAPSPAVAPEVPLVTQLILRPSSAPTTGWFFAGEVTRDGKVQWDRFGNPQSGPDPLDISLELEIRRGVLWLPPDRASLPIRTPRNGDVVVPMLPAGVLVLVPEAMPDPALGAFRVRRTDGVPLPVLREAATGSDPPEIEAVVAPTIVLGMRLGPIPEGPLELEILLGGEVVGRLTAVVRAGKNTPLEIPLRGGLVR